MATITSAGVGSGLDIEGIITKLMAVEQIPITKLNTKEATLQSKLSAYGNLKSSVSTLQSSVQTLRSASLFSKLSATPGDSSVFTANALSIANSGTYNIQVVDLAQAQSISSQTFGSLTTDIASSDGKLKIELGTYSGGTFTPDSGKTPVTIDIAATSSSLSEIRDQINAANAGVKANLVSVDGSGTYKLTLTSTETGAKNSIRLTALDSSGTPLTKNNTGLAKFSFDPTASSGTGKEFDVNLAAQDAHIKVDNLDVYRSTNSITDAITGVTLNVAKQGTTTLTIAKDSSSVKTAIDSFVKAYNDIAKQIKTVTAYNAQTKAASVLTGDSGVRSLQSSLRSMIFTNVNVSATSTLHSLSNIGISLQDDGTLQVDSSKLDEALKTSPSDVASLFTMDGPNGKGIAVQMYASLTSILDKSGLIASRTDGINRLIDDLDKRRTTLATRLTQIEARYRAQYSALDSTVSSMQSTSQYLTQQLASLSKSG